MKKVLKVILIIVAILAVAGIITYIVLNKEKTPITSSKFYSTMQQKGYVLKDEEELADEYDFVKKIYVAASDDYSYQIEFYEFTDVENAVNFYNNNANIFETKKGNVSAYANVNGKNYSKYTLSTNGNYMALSRIDNTVVYIDVDDQYKDIVNGIVNELGY